MINSKKLLRPLHRDKESEHKSDRVLLENYWLNKLHRSVWKQKCSVSSWCKNRDWQASLIVVLHLRRRNWSTSKYIFRRLYYLTLLCFWMHFELEGNSNKLAVPDACIYKEHIKLTSPDERHIFVTVKYRSLYIGFVIMFRNQFYLRREIWAELYVL